MSDDERAMYGEKERELRLVESDGETMRFMEKVKASPDQIRRGVMRKRGQVVFAMIERDALLKMYKGLTPTQMFLVQFMLTQSDQENGECRLNITEIGKIAGIHRVQVSRALTVLQSRDFVKRLGQSRWIVNPHVGWRGPSEAWMRALYTMGQPQWESGE